MKNTLLFKSYYFFLASLFIIGFSSCLDDDCTEERVFLEYRAIYVQPAEFRIDPSFQENRALKNTGKMYFYQDRIFINERNEGIHIIDNSDPSNPNQLGFIHIPGNLDIAIKDGILYADNYTDLLTIDINDYTNPLLLCRDEEVFLNYYHLDPEQGYYIGLEATENSMRVDCSDPNFGDDIFNRGGFIFALEANTLDGGVPTAGGDVSNTGTGGSFARFTISDNYLFVLNDQELKSFRINNDNKPVESGSHYVSWRIETIFPYGDYLFIGANNGMFIYDKSNPEALEYVSEFRHANACDPVFVKDDIAYVTLREGTQCQNFINQLDVLDVSNIRSPQLIASYDMDHPHGLSVIDNNLYLCEGSFGLKVFETDDLKEISDNRIEHIQDIHAFDAIGLSTEHLLIIGDDGLYQYNIENPSNLKEISFLGVEK